MSPRLLPWRPHLALLLWIVMLCAWHAGAHASSESLQSLATDTSASPAERVQATRLLASRASASQAQVEALGAAALQGDEPLLRALAAGADLLRFGADQRSGPPPVPPVRTEAILQRLTATPSPSAEEWLWFVLYRRKVGGMQVGAKRRLDLQEAAWTLAALSGQAPPNNQVWQHVQERARAAWRGPR
ncbi:MAG: hypothetical protein ACI8QC_001754 [Planctomycetota bacterium]|jgi:hypothetical protein